MFSTQEKYVTILLTPQPFNLKGGGTRVPAKLVDLDPQAHKFAEVWGWRILVGEYFSADFVPAPFQYRWVKTANSSDGDAEQGAAGQSQLTNIIWSKRESRILEELRNATDSSNGNLSIRFNMDAFNELPEDPYFGWGRITGNLLVNECRKDYVITAATKPKTSQIEKAQDKIFEDSKGLQPVHGLLLQNDSSICTDAQKCLSLLIARALSLLVATGI